MQTEKAKSSHFDRTRGLKTRYFPPQSFQLSFELLFKLQIELEGNLLHQNLDGLENELSRI